MCPSWLIMPRRNTADGLCALNLGRNKDQHAPLDALILLLRLNGDRVEPSARVKEPPKGLQDARELSYQVENRLNACWASTRCHILVKWRGRQHMIAWRAVPQCGRLFTFIAWNLMTSARQKNEIQGRQLRRFQIAHFSHNGS
ncbi:hypothetical protein AC1031_020702 [Aphanomyces cochlioides]|nr:hypothetical protein AC1031_020702 [Aphanomyces cochlioides]